MLHADEKNAVRSLGQWSNASPRARAPSSPRGPGPRFSMCSSRRKSIVSRSRPSSCCLRDSCGGAKRPAIVYVHGAGIATSVLQQWGSYNELRYVYNAYLANKGYVVLDLDYRGSTGYGRDWRSDVYLHLGGKDLEDVLGAVDYLKTLGNDRYGPAGHLGCQLRGVHDQHGAVSVSGHIQSRIGVGLP